MLSRILHDSGADPLLLVEIRLTLIKIGQVDCRASFTKVSWVELPSALARAASAALNTLLVAAGAVVGRLAQYHSHGGWGTELLLVVRSFEFSFNHCGRLVKTMSLYFALRRLELSSVIEATLVQVEVEASSVSFFLFLATSVTLWSHGAGGSVAGRAESHSVSDLL